jgi:hypothetical protein
VRALENSAIVIISTAGDLRHLVVKMKLMQLMQSVVLAAGLSLLVMPAVAADAGTALDGTTILADPSLANGRVLPASAATSGVATVSAAEDGPLQNCSRHNPCAMPTPSRDGVTVAAGQTAAFEATHGPSHRTHRVLAGTPGLHS